MPTAVENITHIIEEKTKEIAANGNPVLDEEGCVVAGQKRMTLDEPPMVKKADPLR